MSVSFKTSHFSIFSVIGMVITGTVKTFESIFTATVADSLRTTGAEQPSCTNQEQARSDGYSISSTTKTDTVYWCFGKSDNKRVLTIVNNRRYPLQLTRGSAYMIESEDPAAGDELASLSKFAENKHQSILAPGDSITYTLSVRAGSYSQVQTAFDGLGNSLYQLQVGVETALSFLAKDGVIKKGSAAKRAVAEAKMIGQALKDTHCANAVYKIDLVHIVPDCLDAAGVFDEVGAVGVVVATLSTASSLINFFHSSANASWDNLTGHDRYTIKIAHVIAKPKAPTKVVLSSRGLSTGGGRPVDVFGESCSTVVSRVTTALGSPHVVGTTASRLYQFDNYLDVACPLSSRRFSGWTYYNTASPSAGLRPIVKLFTNEGYGIGQSASGLDSVSTESSQNGSLNYETVASGITYVVQISDNTITGYEAGTFK